jgi:hypothetical protein
MKLILKNCSIEFAKDFTLPVLNETNGYLSQDNIITGNSSYGNVLSYDVSKYNKVHVEVAIPSTLQGTGPRVVWATRHNGNIQSSKAIRTNESYEQLIDTIVDTSTCDELLITNFAGANPPDVSYVQDSNTYMLLTGEITSGYYKSNGTFVESSAFKSGVFDVSDYSNVTIIASGLTTNGIPMYILKNGDSIVKSETGYSENAESITTTALTLDVSNVTTLIVQSLSKTTPTVKVLI